MKSRFSNVYHSLQKKRNRIRVRAFIMAFLLLGINSFAWFIFITNGESHINADVIGWDIAFLDADEQTEILQIELEDLYPGMPTYKKEIIIQNRSDVDATFAYEISDVTIFGDAYEVGSLGEVLQDDLPFKFTFSYDKTDLAKTEKMSFKVIVDWPFEALEPYYKLNSIYTYNSMISYYDESHQLVEVNEENFDSLIASGLYVESDDADTYWGEKNIIYKEEHPEENVLSLKLKLTVTQKKS